MTRSATPELVAATRPRTRARVRALAIVLCASSLLGLAELPALLGLLSYAALQDPNRISDAFVADAHRGFRRPTGFSWTGPVRGDLASAWNVPLAPAKTLRFTTDDRGYRNLQSRTAADIVLLGDSFVEGWYVSDTDTTAARLEQRMARPVANLGVSGYGTLQELDVLRRDALPLGPKLVAWFFFEGNDLYDDQEHENTLLYLEDHDVGDLGFELGVGIDWPRFRRASLTRNAYRRLRYLLHPLWPTPLGAHTWFEDAAGARHLMAYQGYAALEYTDYERDRLETTFQAFRDGATAARALGAATVIFFVPMKYRIYGDLCERHPNDACRTRTPWELPKQFLAICAERGLTCVDLTAPMDEAAAAGELLYAPEDSHWNEAGHALVAEQVHAAWRRRGP